MIRIEHTRLSIFYQCIASQYLNSSENYLNDDIHTLLSPRTPQGISRLEFQTNHQHSRPPGQNISPSPGGHQPDIPRGTLTGVDILDPWHGSYRSIKGLDF